MGQYRTATTYKTQAKLSRIHALLSHFEAQAYCFLLLRIHKRLLSIRHQDPTFETINLLPSELWLSIFTLACTDGGYTGCSLSLVNEAIHYISSPVRLYSVSLTSKDQMSAFLSFLSSAPASSATVRHLLGMLPFAGSGSPVLGDAWRLSWDYLLEKKG